MDALGDSHPIKRDQPQPGWTLTEWEWLGLRKPFNLADGHAHFRLPENYYPDLASIAMESLTSPESLDQESAEQGFLSAWAQLSCQSMEPARAALHYSSSVTIEMAGKVAREIGVVTMGVITPTFDNIPLLLRRTGLQLVPLPEEVFWKNERARLELLDQCGGIFLVVPNNPTGYCPTKDQLIGVMSSCAEHGKLAVLDFSFRLYSGLHSWDQYAFADNIAGLNFVFIEDTGKVYPLAEMKVGVGYTSSDLTPTLARVSDELLLNTSPVILQMLEAVVRSDLSRNGTSVERCLDSEAVVAINRKRLFELLADVTDLVATSDSRLSVAWLQLRDARATEVCAGWAERGLVVLPGTAFHWNEPALGEAYVRVALARDPELFAKGADLLRTEIRRLR